MSKSNVLLTNDRMQHEIRDGYEDSVDFFAGNKVTLEKKKVEVEAETNDDAESTESDGGIKLQQNDQVIAGLEKLVLGFGDVRPSSSDYFFHAIDGQEGFIATGKSIIDAIWQFIKDVGNWIHNLFTNRIARLNAKVKLTIQERKINGIKTQEVRYPASVKRLLVPSMVSTNPNWVNNAVKEAEKFYINVIYGHNKLKDYIKERPKSAEELKELQQKVLNDLGRVITKNPPKTNLYQTGILPGNRIFNIRMSTSDNSSEILTYFTDSSASVGLKTEKWAPDQSIIDEAISTMESFVGTINKEQKNSSTLLNNFSNEVKRIRNESNEIAKETKQYYVWLTNLNKRLVNSTLQYATYCIEALNDFIGSGVK